MLDLEQLAESEELFDGHYRLMYPLSTDGATADIWLAVDTNTVDDDESDYNDEEQGLKVAIKVYRPQNALDIEGTQRFRNEFKVVFNCQHSNLLHPVHFSIYKETPYLVLPYCKNGSTEWMVGHLHSDDDIWKFIHDVSSGLDYLHGNNPPIVHQDIKPANILIDDNRNYTITDFGISISRKHRWHDIEENSGTLAYMAPERFVENANPMTQSDIWAFGATLYELVTGHVPFGEDGGSNQMAEKPSLQFPKDACSKNVQRLICACLCKAPQNRPTAKQLMEYAQNKSYSEPVKYKKKVILGIACIFLCGVFVFVVFSLATHSKSPLDNTSPKQILNTVVADDDDSQKQYQIGEEMAALLLINGLDEIPSFQGGNEELCRYLSKNIRIESGEYDKQVVSVSFVVNKDGVINDHLDIKAPNPEMENKIHTVIKNMPRWKPGQRKGHPVPVQVRFFFLFEDKVTFKTSLSSEIYRLNIND